jgi:hypothetical protein
LFAFKGIACAVALASIARPRAASSLVVAEVGSLLSMTWVFLVGRVFDRFGRPDGAGLLPPSKQDPCHNLQLPDPARASGSARASREGGMAGIPTENLLM